MKSRLRNVFILIILFISGHIPVSSAPLMVRSENMRMKIFYTEADTVGKAAVLKGKVIDIGTRDDGKIDDLGLSVQGRSKVSVRLINKEGLQKGDQLFIINDRNIITARFAISSIVKSNSFEYIAVGYGSFLVTSENERVVMFEQNESGRFAYVQKARGDYFKETGDMAQAVKYYEKAIELDRNYPEAHIALGYIYLDKKIIPFAMKEFNEAYKQAGRIYDNEDRYMLMRGLVETRYQAAYFSILQKGSDQRSRYIKDGIKFGEEALAIYPLSKEINFYLGMFYYNNPNPDDVKAKQYLLRVIELDSQNVQAYIALARLYKNHRNKQKAQYYAECAAKIDPTNEQVQDLMRKIKMDTISTVRE